jgi:hypothetical protein
MRSNAKRKRGVPFRMHTADRDRLLHWASVAALTVISLISRLPQLSSPHLLLDGDECILGLMAKHIAEGREFPIFLYGQIYGLSVVEAPAGALSFLIAGTGTLPLKLAMLALWTGGIVAYFLAVSRLSGTARSFWITLVLILMPAWALSSMKAWSGYITAFAATAVLLNLLIRYQDRPRSVAWLMSGALTAIIYLAQPLWLPAVLPIVVFLLVAHRTRAFGLLYLTGIASVLFVIRIVPAGSLFNYWTPPDRGNHNLLGSFPKLFEQLYVNLTGSYYLRSRIDPGPVTAAVAYLWYGILIAATLLQVYRLVSRRYLLWSHLLFMSVVSTLLANWMLLVGRDARYLLPLSPLLVLWAGVEACDLADRGLLSARVRVAAISCVIGLEALSMIEFRNYSYLPTHPTNNLSEEKRMAHVLGYMEMMGARHAFSMNPLLQWQLAFYSKEEIVARWIDRVDRYPAYVIEVDRALQSGETVAVVGYEGSTGGLEKIVTNPEAIVTVDDRYFVYIGADKALLKKMGARFLDD